MRWRDHIWPLYAYYLLDARQRSQKWNKFDFDAAFGMKAHCLIWRIIAHVAFIPDVYILSGHLTPSLTPSDHVLVRQANVTAGSE